MIKFNEFMITVEEATALILSHSVNFGSEVINLSDAIGRILAESITSDRDLPPYDRVTMDGIAINSKSFFAGPRSFTVEGVQAAGQSPLSLQSDDGCLEVMTGTFLPHGTDAIIPYELVNIQNGVATTSVEKVAPFQNVHRQGADAKFNEVLLSPGQKISPAEIALLASVGKSSVKAFSFPNVAIISTGDELIDVNLTPLPHQVRRSNDAALQASLREMGCVANPFHLLDDRKVLEERLRVIFSSHNVIILSGGVSKGKFDFIPETLASLGVQKIFHHVSQRPGKPFWFGRSESHTVFALPGNPVSTYLCFYRYLKPWLQKCLSGKESETQQAVLAKDFTFEPDLTYFLQVKIENDHGKLMAWPKAGGGSGDFANLKEVDGFLELPQKRSSFRAGEVFKYYSFRS